MNAGSGTAPQAADGTSREDIRGALAGDGPGALADYELLQLAAACLRRAAAYGDGTQEAASARVEARTALAELDRRELVRIRQRLAVTRSEARG